MMALMGGMVVFVAATMMFFAWLMGARFDLAIAEIMNGNFRPPAPSAIQHQDL